MLLILGVTLMTTARKHGLVMLLSVLFWIAAPTVTCLAQTGPHSHHDCCAAMMQDCTPTMTSSCCRLAPRNAPPAVSAEYAPACNPQHAILSHTFSLASVNDFRISQHTLQSLSIPEASPGLSLSLRI